MKQSFAEKSKKVRLQGSTVDKFGEMLTTMFQSKTPQPSSSKKTSMTLDSDDESSMQVEPMQTTQISAPRDNLIKAVIGNFDRDYTSPPIGATVQPSNDVLQGYNDDPATYTDALIKGSSVGSIKVINDTVDVVKSKHFVRLFDVKKDYNGQSYYWFTTDGACFFETMSFILSVSMDSDFLDRTLNEGFKKFSNATSGLDLIKLEKDRLLPLPGSSLLANSVISIPYPLKLNLDNFFNLFKFGNEIDIKKRIIQSASNLMVYAAAFHNITMASMEIERFNKIYSETASLMKANYVNDIPAYGTPTLLLQHILAELTCCLVVDEAFTKNSRFHSASEYLGLSNPEAQFTKDLADINQDYINELAALKNLVDSWSSTKDKTADLQSLIIMASKIITYSDQLRYDNARIRKELRVAEKKLQSGSYGDRRVSKGPDGKFKTSTDENFRIRKRANDALWRSDVTLHVTTEFAKFYVYNFTRVVAGYLGQNNEFRLLNINVPDAIIEKLVSLYVYEEEENPSFISVNDQLSDFRSRLDSLYREEMKQYEKFIDNSPNNFEARFKNIISNTLLDGCNQSLRYVHSCAALSSNKSKILELDLSYFVVPAEKDDIEKIALQACFAEMVSAFITLVEEIQKKVTTTAKQHTFRTENLNRIKLEMNDLLYKSNFTAYRSKYQQYLSSSSYKTLF